MSANRNFCCTVTCNDIDLSDPDRIRSKMLEAINDPSFKTNLEYLAVIENHLATGPLPKDGDITGGCKAEISYEKGNLKINVKCDVNKK